MKKDFAAAPLRTARHNTPGEPVRRLACRLNMDAGIPWPDGWELEKAMARFLSPIIWLLAVMPTAASWAQTECENEAVNPVSLGVSSSARPYIFPESGRGLELDIVRGALANEGYQLCPVYVPGMRAVRRFARGGLDALLNVQQSLYGGHLSDVVISFQNCAFSLSGRQLELGALEDLGGYRVAAFHGARVLLPERFATVIPEMASYMEVVDQKVQLQLLYRERVDLIVLEERIFAYYRQRRMKERAEAGMAADPPVDRHCLFKPAPYRIEFADPALRDAFNTGLRKLRESGRYQQILDLYAEEDVRDRRGLPTN